METIYTIPVNEAFEKVQTDGACTCPFCVMYNRLEDTELDLILGASMMEPDVRVKTNELGFCETHLSQMFERGKRLPLALILESHLDHLAEEISGSMNSLMIGRTADNTAKTLEKLESSCYICERIENNFSRMIETAALLWDNDEKFREKVSLSPYFCLKHYGRFVRAGRNFISKKNFAEFYKAVNDVEMKYFNTLREDVSWFCKKFDYRYTEEPWGNAKDSPERAKKFLMGELHIHEDVKKPSDGLT